MPSFIPADLASVRAQVRTLRDADDRYDADHTATALSAGPDREKLLTYIRSEAQLRREKDVELLGGFKDEGLARQRIASLARGELQPQDFMLETYGLSAAGLKDAQQNLEKWITRKRASFKTAAERTSRWAFELFYADLKLLAPKPAAARLSMTVPSLERVLEFAHQHLGFPMSATGEPGVGIREEFISNLYKYFPGLATTVFGDHSHYCAALHKALKEEGVEVDAVSDIGSLQLADAPADATYQLDIVTLEPIGVRYTVWLDFGKPMSLEPDQISIVTYAQFEDQLHSHIASYAQIDERLLQIARAVVGK